jgi:hypothetical protein
MADIFISFIHEDEKVAEGVTSFLRQKLASSSKVFLASDKWAIYAGEDWLQRSISESSSLARQSEPTSPCPRHWIRR